MSFIYHKLPFIIELILNGIFILVYSFVRSKNVPTFLTPEMIEAVMGIASYSVPFTLILVSFLNFKASANFEDFFRKYVFSIIVIIPLLISKDDLLFCYWLSIVHLFSSSLSIYERNPKIKER